MDVNLMMKQIVQIISGVTLVLGGAFSTLVLAAQVETSYVHIPSTISQEAQQFMRALPDPRMMPAFPLPYETEKWKMSQEAAEARNLEMQEVLIDRLRPSIKKEDFGGVPILDVKAKGWKDNGKVLVYIHGGAYTFQSAKSTLVSSALVAERTGLRVISVDYTLAPHSKWRQTITQPITVFNELKKQGYTMDDIAIYGDSAGGGMAASVVLKMRDDGMGMPAAVVLWSPWADITETGDSYETLKQAEPMYRFDKHLKHSADAYADPKDQKNPYVSPVYGDYTKGFPPTLIQGGSKEIFLSNFIRLYQALDSGGQQVKLDLYEGMTHVFQVFMPETLESKLALEKVDNFLKQHLGE